MERERFRFQAVLPQRKDIKVFPTITGPTLLALLLISSFCPINKSSSCIKFNGIDHDCPSRCDNSRSCRRTSNQRRGAAPPHGARAALVSLHSCHVAGKRFIRGGGSSPPSACHRSLKTIIPINTTGRMCVLGFGGWGGGASCVFVCTLRFTLIYDDEFVNGRLASIRLEWLLDTPGH